MNPRASLATFRGRRVVPMEPAAAPSSESRAACCAPCASEPLALPCGTGAKAAPSAVVRVTAQVSGFELLQGAAESLVRRAAAVVVAASERPGLGLTLPQRLEVWDVARGLHGLSHELSAAADGWSPDAADRRELADALTFLLGDLVQAVAVLDTAGAEVPA